jgi:hypothetical protein
MQIGNRRIRSAGRSSGSIEITLPAQLQSLEGVACRLIVRDGPRPEIVLQPDLGAASEIFQALWQRVRLGTAEIDDIGEWAAADFTLAFFPPRHWNERPPLAYADALAILAARSATSLAAEPLCRTLAFLAVAAGGRLGLRPPLSLAFGDTIATLLAGTPAGIGADFERGMALRAFGDSPRPAQAPFDDEPWRHVRPGLRRVFEQLVVWQENPALYTAARDTWYRALSVELIP